MKVKAVNGENRRTENEWLFARESKERETATEDRMNRRKTEEREEVRVIASVLDLCLSDAAQ